MLVFAGFILLVLRVRPGDTPRTSTSLRLLIGYIVVLTIYVGWSGRDLWPFAAWRYVSYAVADTGTFVRLVGVDDGGREYPLDTRTFEPLEFAAVLGDLDYKVDRMSREERTEFLDYLLRLSQEGLARARAGQPVGRFTRILGPLAAPVFHVPVTPWKDRENLPPQLAELRLYRLYWRATGDAARVENQVLLASTRS
jgi:hypothetical protein